MKHTDSSLNMDLHPGWKVLGELRVAMDGQSEVNEWLKGVLRPLDLEAHFLNKVQTSIHEAMQQAVQRSNGTALEHLHLFVLVSADLALKYRCWGFFRIEKVEPGIDNEKPNHTIELYLYPDGRRASQA